MKRTITIDEKEQNILLTALEIAGPEIVDKGKMTPSLRPLFNKIEGKISEIKNGG